MGQASGWVDAVNEDFEGDVLMFQSAQASCSHLGQQLGERWIAVDFDAQDQGVDEKPDQLIKHRVASARNREAHRHIGASAQVGQQQRQGGLHHHETGGVVLAGHTCHLLLQMRGPVDLHTGAAIITHRWIRPIGG
nr:hypothetical protein CPGR_04927 [Mycolicibacterium malmesburyense]